jgi:hypothetical protein
VFGERVPFEGEGVPVFRETVPLEREGLPVRPASVCECGAPVRVCVARLLVRTTTLRESWAASEAA